MRDIVAGCDIDRLIFDECLYEPLTLRRRTQLALPFLYIELWYAKDSWWRLSEDERRSLLGSIDPTVYGDSAQLLGSAVNKSKHLLGNQAYPSFAVWTVDSKETIDRIQQGVRDLGWWDRHFVQHTVWGRNDNLETFEFNVKKPPTLTERMERLEEKLERLIAAIEKQSSGGLSRPRRRTQWLCLFCI